MANSIIILAIVVLPGWISITANQRYHPRIVDRTAVMVWGILFYHAAIVHIVGIALFMTGIWALGAFSIHTLDLERLVAEGFSAYLEESPAAITLASGIYVLWMLLASVVSGVADLPSKLTNSLGWIMNRCKLAPEPVEDEPIWFNALGQERRRIRDARVQVFVRMKNSDIYVGQLLSYPILPDSEKSKDFRLGDSIFYPNGDTNRAVYLNFSDYEAGGVLLNTVNVSSIEYILHEDYRLESGDDTG